jgi:NADPH:quinone reductase-like Zn-dependent oxidoreductase
VNVYEIADGFGIERLRAATRDDRPLGRGEVRVAVHAMSLNYRDLLVARGEYDPRQPLPLIPLSDGAGEVIEVGPDTRRVQVGDRVAGAFAQSWISGPPTRRALASTLGAPLDGMLAERVVLPEAGVVKIPQSLSYVEAATLPCAAVTAWSALVTQGAIHEGTTVLVQGTGGVSVFALQLARAVGARAIVTSSSDAKLERCRALGAAHTINYRTTPEWGRVARELAGPEGVDHVLDVGGAQTLHESLRAVRPGGTISLIGNLSGNVTELSVTRVLMSNIRLQGIFVGHRNSFEALCEAVARHGIRPVIDRVFDFGEAREAFEYLTTQAHFGKVCIRL